jgi:hypothetical protein
MSESTTEKAVTAEPVETGDGVRQVAQDYITHEWHYGPYERMVSVPGGFGGEAFDTFGNGQLAIHLGRGDGRTERVLVQPHPAVH